MHFALKKMLSPLSRPWRSACNRGMLVLLHSGCGCKALLTHRREVAK
jgi:hypothetical protein